MDVKDRIIELQNKLIKHLEQPRIPIVQEEFEDFESDLDDDASLNIILYGYDCYEGVSPDYECTDYNDFTVKLFFSTTAEQRSQLYSKIMCNWRNWNIEKAKHNLIIIKLLP